MFVEELRFGGIVLLSGQGLSKGGG